MPHVVVGTAGHIDHGKSSLVRALTGIDPDRLDEEKRRGITIDLGFADLDLGEGREISFVDVPGHERFVRHMVAGATGIDAVLLVVAADQGVEAQTREHLEICRLLEVPRGVVVLSKCDLVEPELREVVALELRELTERTFLERAPLIEVSVKLGTGLDELREALSDLARSESRRPVGGLARLPIDRAFTMRGFGTVVTGTLVSGTLREGEEIEVLPGASRGRIRGLQVHRRKAEQVLAGRRTAVNLQGLDCADVPRGSTLAHPGQWRTTRRLWARVELLPTAPPALRTRGGPIHFHHGTTDVSGRVRVLATEGESLRHVEIVLSRVVVAAPGDRFILRRPAPVDTVGGGIVVDAAPPSARAARGVSFEPHALEGSNAIVLRVTRAGSAGAAAEALARELGWSGTRLEHEARDALTSGEIVEAASRWFHGATWVGIEKRVMEWLATFHAERALEPGVSREILRARVAPAVPIDAWRALLAGLEHRRQIRLQGEEVALAGHRVLLDDENRAFAEELERRFLEAGLDPPSIESVVGQRAGAGPIVNWLLAQGRLVKIQDRRIFHASALEGLRSRVRGYARTSRTIDVAAFKELAGVTRKNAIPLLEQLDAERVTRRIGNAREILVDPI